MFPSSKFLPFIYLLYASTIISASNLRAGRIAGNVDSLIEGDAGIDEERDLIIGGVDAPKGRFSYMVSLTDNDGQHKCGGSLIAKNVVLTAAHCAFIFGEEGQGQGQVQIGRYDFDDEDEEVDIFHVKKMEVHPEYDSMWLRHDFLLLLLDGSTSTATITQVSPIKLNTEANVPSYEGQSLDVMGWGRTIKDSRESADRLQEVELKYVPNDVCRSKNGRVENVSGTQSYNRFIKDEHLCAFDSLEGQDACHGDSGGPIIVKDDSGNDDVLVGIVSWGFGCVHQDFPGVYARVSTEYDWIKSTACEMSKQLEEDDEDDILGCSLQSETAPTTTEEDNGGVKTCTHKSDCPSGKCKKGFCVEKSHKNRNM